MKVLVTGGSGFLGRCFSRMIHGHEITVTNRQTLNLLDPIVVRKYLQSERFDWVINTAVAGRNEVRSTDPNITAQNLIMFTNLYTNLDALSQGLISIGSGAEYDIGTNIDQVSELEIWNRIPKQSYGLSKNLIARMSNQNPKCYTVRIFGCFDPSEADVRPIKKLANSIQNQTPFVIEHDRWFDMISVTDLVKIIQFVMTGACGFRDINAVYTHKTRLSDILRLYCKLHHQDPKWVQVLAQDGLSYTGDSSRLDLLDLPLLGLNKSLEMYGK